MGKKKEEEEKDGQTREKEIEREEREDGGQDEADDANMKDSPRQDAEQGDSLKVKKEEQPETIDLDPPPGLTTTTELSSTAPDQGVATTAPTTSSAPIAPQPSELQAQQQQAYQPLVHESDCGPLTPDHLREALRRYKKDRQGGSAGLAGLSLGGKERVASRVGGRRLFR